MRTGPGWGLETHGAPAVLSDARGARLSLAVAGYSDPDAPPDGSAWGDANRLDVVLEGELEGRSWRSSGPLLCCGDLSALVAWVRLVAAGHPADPFEAGEPGLGLTGRRQGGIVLLRVRLSHDLAPPFLDADEAGGSDGVALRLRLSVARALAWADRLEELRRRYPRR
ncbi:MAG: hypothetical protein NVS3B18_05660 [Candidatus Dormibacteria bacterium]